MLSTAFWLYGGLLILIAIIVVVIFAVGLTRRTNKRHESNNVVGEPAIPRDPTTNTREKDIPDRAGNFTRSVPDVPQNTGKNPTDDSR